MSAEDVPWGPGTSARTVRPEDGYPSISFMVHHMESNLGSIIMIYLIFNGIILVIRLFKVIKFKLRCYSGSLEFHPYQVMGHINPYPPIFMGHSLEKMFMLFQPLCQSLLFK